MDLITTQRINFLHPQVRTEVANAVTHLNKNILGKNIRLRITHTLRSFDEQNILYAIGRTTLYDNNGKRLKKVTNAKGGQSIHNYGLAFDIAILVDKDANGTFESASWELKADNDYNGEAEWLQVVKHFKALGWTWGGDWKSFPDYPHFEKTFSHNWKSLERRYTSGNNFTEVIEGKIYNWVNL